MRNEPGNPFITALGLMAIGLIIYLFATAPVGQDLMDTYLSQSEDTAEAHEVEYASEDDGVVTVGDEALNHFPPLWPNPEFSSGEIDPNVRESNKATTICKPGYADAVRPPTRYTTPIEKQMLLDYGFPGTSTDYQLDHLIPISLGGHPTAKKNLWPQPRTNSGLAPAGYGSEAKDTLEFELKKRVCANEMPLETAQRAMAGNWKQFADHLGGTERMRARDGDGEDDVHED